MKIKGHPAFPKFRRRIQENQQLQLAWRGMAYRVTSLDYPKPTSILMGQGSFLHGGRWNAPGSFRAVYGSTTDVVAIAESRATADYAGMPFRAPRLLVAIEFDLESVIDLTERETQERLGVDLEELCGEDWRKLINEEQESGTQAFGRAAFEAKLNGLLVPSAKIKGGVNVVYFPGNERSYGEAAVCEPEKLERIEGIE